jgi:hypothetical protein
MKSNTRYHVQGTTSAGNDGLSCCSFDSGLKAILGLFIDSWGRFQFATG